MSSPRLPDWLVRGGGAAWRLLAMGAVVYFGFQLLREISVVVLALVLALFPAAVLWAPVRRLRRRGWREMPSTSLVMAAAVGLMMVVGALVLPPLGTHLARLVDDVAIAGVALRRWLTTGPLGLSGPQIDSFWTSFTEELGAGGGLGAGVLGGATAMVELLTGLFVTAIATFFILKDGPRMFEGLLARLPPHRAEATARATRAGWSTLGHYMRGLAVVGLIDAVLIGLGLLVVGVPMVIPLAILTFLGSFFPLIGAWTAGLFSVAVAFVNGGFTDALAVLLIVTIVQQAEGDLVLPIVFGRTLEMHPLLILVAVAGGGVAFGIAGAFLAVPAVAVAIAVRQELAADPATTFTSLAQGVEAAQEPVINGVDETPDGEEAVGV